MCYPPRFGEGVSIMSKTSSSQENAQKALRAHLQRSGSWRKVEKKLKINRAYLSQIARGKRQPSNRVLAALGLPPRHIAVVPLSCGHAPLRSRCPICKPSRDTRKRRRIELSSLKKLMQSPYSQS